MKKTVWILLTAASIMLFPVYANASIEDVEAYFSDAGDNGHVLTFTEHKGMYTNQLFVVDYHNISETSRDDDFSWLFNQLSNASNEGWFDYDSVQVAMFNVYEEKPSFWSFYNIVVNTGGYNYTDGLKTKCGIIKTKENLDNDTLAYIQNTAMEVFRNRLPDQYIVPQTDNIQIEWFGNAHAKMFVNLSGFYDSDDGKHYDFVLEFTISDLNDGKWNYEEIYTEINGLTLFGEYFNTRDYVIDLS